MEKMGGKKRRNMVAIEAGWGVCGEYQEGNEISDEICN